MFGSVSAWFFRWLGGIQCAEDAVGFDRVLIRPQVVAELTWVKSSHETVRGPVVSNWTIEGDSVRFDITIPPDTEAQIELPAGATDLVTEGGELVGTASALRELPAQPGLRVFGAGSGRYSFEVRAAD
jgi:alpha-L-rhamnosidase